MIENLEVMVSNGGYGLDVREKGMFKSAIEKIKCAVCPECGYTETYVENIDRIKRLINKDKIISKLENEEFETTFYEIGDKVSVSKKKVD